VTTFTFPAGEASKNPGTLLELLTFFAKQELTREDVVIALGGGVTGDLAGLAASLYLRGGPCVQGSTPPLARGGGIAARLLSEAMIPPA